MMTSRATLVSFSLFLLWAVPMVGCYAPAQNVVACEEGSLCDNGQPCTNGSCDMLVDAPPQMDACTAGMCAGGQLIGCGQPQVCGLGCAAATSDRTAHCIELKPSNGFNDWSITDGTSALTVVAELMVNTETGAITEVQMGGVTIRSAGVGLRDGIYFATTAGGPSVFAMQQLTIAAGVTLRLVGGPAVVLLVNTDAVIAGRMDASAGLNPGFMGPGSGSGGAVAVGDGGGCGGGKYGSNDNSMGADGGGGGGGMRDSGGGGGGEFLGGAGGASCDIIDLQPLRGGSGGGSGGAGVARNGFGFGGHGGGAAVGGKSLLMQTRRGVSAVRLFPEIEVFDAVFLAGLVEGFGGGFPFGLEAGHGGGEGF